MRTLPGTLNISEHDYHELVRRIRRKIADNIADNSDFVFDIYLDFDDTMFIFAPRNRQAPLLNQSLVEFLARLIRDVGVKHIKLYIVSTRASEQCLTKLFEANPNQIDIRIHTLLPQFYAALNAVVKQHDTNITIAFDNIHCLMGLKFVEFFYINKQNEKTILDRSYFSAQDWALRRHEISDQICVKKLSLETTASGKNKNVCHNYCPCSIAEALRNEDGGYTGECFTNKAVYLRYALEKNTDEFFLFIDDTLLQVLEMNHLFSSAVVILVTPQPELSAVSSVQPPTQPTAASPAFFRPPPPDELLLPPQPQPQPQ